MPRTWTALLIAMTLVAACESPSDNDRPPPAAIEAVGAATRAGPVGAPAADSLTVKVTDEQGNPVPGVTVTFAAANGGSVSPASAVTRADGTARTQWTLGPTAGEQTATATVADLPAVAFTATAAAAAAAQVVLPDSIRITTLRHSTPIQVSVVDAFGNAVAGQTVLVASRNTAVVEVGGGGAVLGLANGTTRLVATLAGSTVADSAVVVVRQVATQIAEMLPMQLVLNETVQLRPDAHDAGGWLVPDSLLGYAAAGPAVSVTPTGGIKAVALGQDSVRVYTDAASRWVRVSVVSDASVPRVSQVSVGWTTACAVRTDGRLFCWGSDTQGLVGDGPANQAETCNWGWKCYPRPTAVASAQTFRQVEVGPYNVCALTTAGAAYCWGTGRVGALGNGGTDDSPSPVPVSGGHTFVQIAVGAWFACGLTAQGQAWCWGDSWGGRLGNGGEYTHSDASGNYNPVPVQVKGGLSFTAITAGDYHGCGIAGGRAYCWGNNDNGQLGNGIPHSYAEPVPVAGDLSFKNIAAGRNTSCGVTDGGAVYCWGLSTDGDTATRNQTVPTRVPLTGVFDKVDTGGGRSCALATDGRAFCWGLYPIGKRTMFDTSPSFRLDGPAQVPGSVLFSGVASGHYSSCGIDTVGRLRCWHSNAYGLLGNGSINDSAEPVFALVPPP